MAILSFKVNADYEKVAKLREEISKLEAQLKGFGRNAPDADVKAVENQLAAVTRQYEEMTKKIAETEAKYDLLAKKMTDKAKEISNAQSKVADAAVNPQGKVLTPQIDYSVEAQARGYEELKSEIDAIAGSKINLITQMMNEQNAIRLINAELKQLSAEQSANGKLTRAQFERQAQLNDSLLVHKQALSEVRQSLANYVKLEGAASGSMDEISQSLSRMRMVYRSLTAEERNSPFGQELLASIHQADAQIKELDATIGNHQRNVGNYAGQWNGLNMSIQQLGRELPALAYGPKVFFSAISNNLPILTDEIKRAKDEYNALKAAGEEGTPVWKQVASSLFSWQTALTVGITLLTMHGDKLIEWGKKLILGAKGVTSTERAVKKMNKTIAEGAKEAAKEVVELKVLEKVATDVARSDDERNKAAKRVLETLNESVTSINLLKVKNGEYKAAIDEVTMSLLRQAQAQAVMTEIQDKYKSVIDAQSKLSQREGKGTTFWDKIRASWRSGILAEAGMEGVSDEQIRQDRLDKLKKSAEKAQEEFNVWFESFTDKFSFDDIFGTTSNAEVNNYLVDALAEIERITKMEADWAKEKARVAKDSEFSIEQARIDAMKDGYIKNRAQRLLNHKKQIEDLERQKQDYIETVVEQEKAIFDAREEQKAKNNEKYKKQSFNRAAAAANVDTSAYDALISQTRQTQAESEDEYLKGLYSQYMSYEDKKKELTKEYLDDLLALNTEYILTGDEKYKRSIDERRKAYVQSVNALESEFNTAEYQLVFGDPSKMTRETIEKALGVARKMMSELDKEADPEYFKALSEAIDNLEDARDNNPFEGWGTSLMDVLRTMTRIRNLDKDIEEYKKQGNTKAQEAAETQLEKSKHDLKNALIGTGATEFADSLTQAADAMREIAEAAGDVQLSGMAEQLGAWAQNLTAAAQGAASGGWIGAIVGGVSDIISQTVQFFVSSKVSAEQTTKEIEDFKHQIELLQYVVDEADFSNIFGTDELDISRDALEKAKMALSDYQSMMDELNSNTMTTLYEKQEQAHSLGAAIMLGSWGSMRKVVSNEMKGALEAFEKGYSQLEAMQVKTKDVNGWGNFWGFQDEFTSLKDLAPDLWGEDGVFDVEAARLFLETNTQLNEEQRKQIQNIIDLKDAYNEADEALEAYLSDLFGTWGEDIGSIISDSVLQGTDAWDVFEQKGADVIKRLGQQAIYTTFFKDTMDAFTEPLKNAVGNPDEMATQTALLMEQLKDNFDAAQQWLKDYYDKAEGMGFDMQDLGLSSQSASVKGYQTLSEDTGNELVGRALAQYESNLRMEESMRTVKDGVDVMTANQVQMRDIAAESRALIADSYLELQQIRENTGNSAKVLKAIDARMTEWDSKIKSL